MIDRFPPLWLLLSGICFSGMAILVQTLAADVNHYWLVFFRSFVSLLLVSAMLFFRPQKLRGPFYKLLIFRGLAGFTGLSLFFFALTRLPLAMATLINWSSPVFVILLARVFLGEKFPAKLYFWMALAFAGLFLIQFGALETSSSGWDQVPISPLAVWAAIAGAVTASIAYVSVRAATKQASVLAILFYFSGVGTICSLPIALYSGEFLLTGEILVKIFFMGLCATVAQYGLTQGFRLVPAGMASILNLSTPLVSGIIGVVFFGERYSLLQTSGLILLAGGLLAIALQPLWEARKQGIR